MATLRSYSATFEQAEFNNAAVTRLRFNEGSGTEALDSIDGLDGTYETGAAPGAAGSIGDGAASFNGDTGFVLVETLSGTITVSAFGDSEIAGDYPVNPVPAPQRFSPQLEAVLDGRGLDANVINQGVGGNTSARGLARVDDVIDDNPDVVIVEFGTNDARNQIAIDTVDGNLRDIVDALQGAQIDEILLTGAFGFYPGQPPATQGYETEQERDDFEALYPNIASATGVELLDAEGDKFLGGSREGEVITGGVLGDPALNVGDGLHPNAAGVQYIVGRVAPQTIALGAAAGVVNEPLLLGSGSFEMWFTLDNLNGQQELFAKDSAGRGTGGQVAAIVNGNGQINFALSDETTVFSAQSDPGVVDANTPTHLVANFGADGMHVFINGVEVASNDYTGGLDAGLGNFEQLVIGAGNGLSTPGTVDDVNQFFDGVIDEFAVYTRALTGGEVQQLFDGGEHGTAIVGTASADTIIGGSDFEELRGAGGDDVIDGNAGNDELRGGAGNDVMRGAQGNDEIYGGSGSDELRGGAGNDSLDGKDGSDLLASGQGDDVLRGSGGADELSAAGGNDELYGNSASDNLRGGTGDDLLNGGNGPDALIGGAGSDRFQIDKVSHGVDKIFDFEAGAGGDVLDLSAVLNFDTGDNVNDFVRLDPVGGSTRVEVDPNGGGDNFTAVFNLIGASGLDIGNLVDDGNVDLGAPTS